MWVDRTPFNLKPVVYKELLLNTYLEQGIIQSSWLSPRLKRKLSE